MYFRQNLTFFVILCIVRGMRKLALAAALSVSTVFGGAAAYANDNVFVQAENSDALIEFSQDVGSVGFVLFEKNEAKAQKIASDMKNAGGFLFADPQYIMLEPPSDIEEGAIQIVTIGGFGAILLPEDFQNSDVLKAAMMVDFEEADEKYTLLGERLKDEISGTEARIKCLETATDVDSCPSI